MTQAELERAVSQHFARREEAEGCSGEWEPLLVRRMAGELEASEGSALAAHLQACSECREVLALIGEAAVTQKPRVAPRPRFAVRASRWLGVAAAAGIALFAVYVGRGKLERDEDRLGELVPKGSSFALHVAAERSGHSFVVADGAHLSTGDGLGFFYTAGEPAHLTVLFVDDAGEVGKLFPASAKGSAHVQGGTQVRLPDGALLSPGSGCEWVVGLFAPVPLEDDRAVKAVRQMWEARKGCELGPVPLDGTHAHVTGLRR